MPRPKRTDPCYQLNVEIPSRLKALIDLALYSPLEQRIPVGRLREFVVAALEQALTKEQQP